jgi:cytochrome c biogenesis protein
VKKGESLEAQLARTLSEHSGSAAKNANNKDLKNVGPSVQYKLRDKTGQAREFMNYMQPVTLEGAEVYLAGVRSNPSDPFSFLRIPADDKHGVREWMRLRAALADPGLREEAARRYAERAMPQAAAAPRWRASCRNRRPRPWHLRRRGQWRQRRRLSSRSRNSSSASRRPSRKRRRTSS